MVPRSTNISSAADDLLRKLLCDSSQRRGNSVNELKNHPFFVGINWNTDPRLYAAPYIPTIHHPTDTSNFDPVAPNHAPTASIDDTPRSSHAFYEFTFRRFFHDELLPDHGKGGRFPSVAAAAAAAAETQTSPQTVGDMPEPAYVDMKPADRVPVSSNVGPPHSSSIAMRNNMSPVSGYGSIADGRSSATSAISQYYDTSSLSPATVPEEPLPTYQTAIPPHQQGVIDSSGLATYV